MILSQHFKIHLNIILMLALAFAYFFIFDVTFLALVCTQLFLEFSFILPILMFKISLISFENSIYLTIRLYLDYILVSAMKIHLDESYFKEKESSHHFCFFF
jgi:hypothetical protein